MSKDEMKENKELEVVGPGKFVAYSYKLSEVDPATGEVKEELFEATPEQPDVMVYGVSHEIVPGLVAAMKDLSKGSRFETVLPPEAAFGQRFDDNVLELDKAIFTREDGTMAEEVKVGAMLPMMTQEGYRIMGRVLEVNDKVKMDFNHPFAGKTVKYEGEIVEVRDATPEELQPIHGCGGCGCDHGSSCNDCESGACGDGCGSHDHNHEGGCCGHCH